MATQTITSRRAAAGRGFTLAELLVVIAIIALLMGILVPAVSRVRGVARKVVTESTLAALGSGLEMFKADGRIGGDYPPSFSDADNLVCPRGAAKSPYVDGSQCISISGAGLLVWALVGADQLGTPGFKPFRTNSSRWSDDTDRQNSGDDPTASGAYALYADGRTLQPRSGPYIELGKVRMSTWDVARFPADPNFVVPAEETANPNFSALRRSYPMFLDGNGFPILYWKADSAGVQMADSDRQSNVGTARGVYHWEDNRELVADTSTQRLILRPGASDHRLDFPWTNTSQFNPVNNLPPYDTFARYIMNPTAAARLTPYRSDSYLLISPGEDGLYGTADDVANFEHGGR